MLSRVDIMTRRGQVLTFDLGDEESGYAVREIEGLDPVKATLVSSAYAGADGEQFQSAKRGARNIKIKLDFQPDFVDDDYTALRQRLYDYLMPKSEISVRFYQTTGLYLDIIAQIESIDSPLFVQDPDADISLMCYQPDFIDPRLVELTGSTVNNSTIRNIVYPGTVETGTLFTLLPARDVPAFSLYNTSEDGVISQFDFAGPLESGDRLVINSITGAKGVYLTRDGVTTSYLYGRVAQSSWIQFFPGLNEFRAYAVGDPIPYELEYSARYGGL